LSFIDDGVSKGVNDHYWEGKLLVVKISKLLKGLKKVHYLICSSNIDTLEPDSNAYSWKGKEPMFFFTTTLKRKMLKDFKPKINLVEKRWVGVFPFTFKLRWMNIWCKTPEYERGGLHVGFVEKAIAINT